MKIIWLVFCVLSVATIPHKCDDIEYRLIHSILKNYDSSIRPSDHHNSTLNVTFGLALTQLIDVDERNMIVTTNCWLNQDWIDSGLKWDPSKFNNIKSVHIPAEKLWKPDILLVNNADVWAKISVISTNAIVKYTGNVTWLSAVIFKSSCSINVRYFPFDEQVCDMIFASWTFDGYFLDINVNSGEGDTTNYIKNGEWHLVKLLAIKNLKKYSCCEEPYPEIVYRLVIRRRPLYYLFNMVFPCLLITMVAFLGFYLPPGSTEKISIGITTLLSITVFLMMVAESMPPTSEQLPLLSIYYAVTIGIVSCSTAMAVITLNINNKGSTGARVPKVIKIIFFSYLAKILRTKLSNKSKKKTVKTINEAKAPVQNVNNIKQTVKLNKKPRSDHTSSLKILEQKNANNKKDYFKYEENDNKIKLVSTKKPIEIILAESSESKSNETLNKIDDMSLNNNNNTNANNNGNNKIMLISTPLFQNLDSKNESLSLNLAKTHSPLYLSSNYNGNTNVINKPNHIYISKRASDSDDNTPVWTQNDESLHVSSVFLDEYKKASLSYTNDESNSKMLVKSTDNKLCNVEFILELGKLLDKQFSPLVKNILRVIERNDKNYQDKEKHEFIQNEWSDVSKICDHLMCYIFPILTISTCLFIFLNSPHTLPFSQW